MTANTAPAQVAVADDKRGVRTTPPYAVTGEAEPDLDTLQSHSALTSEEAQMNPELARLTGRQMPGPATRASATTAAGEGSRQPPRPHRQSRTRRLARRSRMTQDQPRRHRRQASPHRPGHPARGHRSPARHARVPSIGGRTATRGHRRPKPDNQSQITQFKTFEHPWSRRPARGARCRPPSRPPGCTSSPSSLPAARTPGKSWCLRRQGKSSAAG